MVDESLMCICNSQESNKTPNSSASQNNAKRDQGLLRSRTRADRQSESPDCNEQGDIKQAECVFPLPLGRLGFREGCHGMAPLITHNVIYSGLYV